MKLLVIDEEFPYPLNTGKRIRSFHLTKGLAQHHELTYLAYGEPDSEAAAYLREHRITPIAVPPPDRRQSGIKFYARLFFNLFSPYPYIVTSHYTEAFQKQVRELVGKERFEVVISEWTPYAIFLRQLEGCKRVIVAHNIESSIWRRYERNESNPLKRWYISIQRKKVEAFEKSCFRWVDGAISVSEAEAEELHAYGLPYRVGVVENGVDLDYFLPTEEESESSSLVFTGSMDWRPNQDAVSYFVKDIFPLIRSEKPEVTVTIVGRKPPKKITDLRQVPGVTVTGTVEDVRPYMAKAAVFIVPLRIGGGSRLKILEAMAMKKAVVSTSIGAEGLNVTPGRDILIGDTPEEFARQVLNCLDSPEVRKRLAEEGRALVRRQYGWERLSEKYARYLSELLGSS